MVPKPDVHLVPSLPSGSPYSYAIQSSPPPSLLIATLLPSLTKVMTCRRPKSQKPKSKKGRLIPRKERACATCRLRKVRCSQTRPACELCSAAAVSRGIDLSSFRCHYMCDFLDKNGDPLEEDAWILDPALRSLRCGEPLLALSSRVQVDNTAGSSTSLYDARSPSPTSSLSSTLSSPCSERSSFRMPPQTPATTVSAPSSPSSTSWPTSPLQKKTLVASTRCATRDNGESSNEEPLSTSIPIIPPVVASTVVRRSSDASLALSRASTPAAAPLPRRHTLPSVHPAPFRLFPLPIPPFPITSPTREPALRPWPLRQNYQPSVHATLAPAYLDARPAQEDRKRFHPYERPVEGLWAGGPLYSDEIRAWTSLHRALSW